MYFNHAYQKTLINTNNFYSTTKNTVSTIGVPTAQVAVIASLQTSAYNANTVVDTTAFGATTIQELPMIYLAQGSINTVDKLGPFAGGYKESVKTKGINPKYVNKFFRVDPTCPQAEVRTVCLCDGAEAQCGTSYYLRIDVKGSPALRFLTHNAYRTYGSTNICCPADPTASTAVSAMQVQTSWAWQIARDPIMNNFILPILTWNSGGGITTFNVSAWYAANPTATDVELYTAVQDSGDVQDYTYISENNGYPASEEEAYVVEATDPCLALIGSYVDTQFGTCSFHPQDFYELAPVKIYTSITDQQGDPCVDQIFCTPIEPAQLGLQGSGYGHKLLRDAILFRRYMQEQYVYDPRLREVMNQDKVYNYIVGTDFYTTYGILHSVPRFNNPTSTFDNDQYLVTIVQPDSACGTDTGKNTQFENWMNAYLAKAGNGVQLEILS
jgi:hypothetical protein